jgi:indolepyruvate ferredoxin oxidoreductase alpha subunit
MEKCTQCGTCLRLGCAAIQTSTDGQVSIDATLCAGDICTICEQLCPKQAISAQGNPKS